MRMAIGLAITDMGTRGGVSDAPDAGSAALRLLQNESDGLAIVFTDQSAVVKDTP